MSCNLEQRSKDSASLGMLPCSNCPQRRSSLLWLLPAGLHTQQRLLSPSAAIRLLIAIVHILFLLLVCAPDALVVVESCPQPRLNIKFRGQLAQQPSNTCHVAVRAQQKRPAMHKHGNGEAAGSEPATIMMAACCNMQHERGRQTQRAHGKKDGMPVLAPLVVYQGLFCRVLQ